MTKTESMDAAWNVIDARPLTRHRTQPLEPAPACRSIPCWIDFAAAAVLGLTAMAAAIFQVASALR